MYYYIVNNKRIVGFPTEVNLILNNGFKLLTNEQTKFYLENSNASIREVLNCKLNEPYIPPVPEVSDYAAEKKKELKEMCYKSVTITSLEYAMANACLAGTSLTYTGDKFYSITEAKSIMKQFMDESTRALTYYKNYGARIDLAQSIEEIDNIMEEINGILNGISE